MNNYFVLRNVAVEVAVVDRKIPNQRGDYFDCNILCLENNRKSQERREM